MSEETPKRRLTPYLSAAALVAAGLVGGAVLAGTMAASASEDGSGSNGSEDSIAVDTRSGSGMAEVDPSQPMRDDEELLTGETATRVTDVVTAAYPDATIQRVETDSDGVYEAHIVTAEGSELIVMVGKDFSITGTGEMGPR